MIADAGNDRVAVYDQEGNFQYAIGAGQLSGASGIAIDPANGHVFVGKYYGGTVLEYANDGTYIGSIGGGNIPNPCGVALQPGTGNLLVSTGFGHVVDIFTQGGAAAGSFGSSANFGYACDIAVAPGGKLYISDETNTNVQVFTSAGAPLFAFGSGGSGNGQFSAPSPTALAVDPTSGRVIVADYGNDRVEIFDGNGRYIEQFGSSGSGDGQFSGPFGVALDAGTHSLFIGDRGNNRVEVFSSCGPSPVSISALPQTQQFGQPTLFTVTISNIVQPGGTVSVSGEDGTVLCSAATFGDPQAACSGFVGLGVHLVTAEWSGDGINPSGCSSALTVAAVTDLTPMSSTLNLVGPPNNIDQGNPFTLTANVQPGPVAGQRPQTAPAQTGFVTFYDGSNALAAVPLAAGQALYSNRIGPGSHTFRAVYSGDGSYTTANDSTTIATQAPADEIYYGNFEVAQGN